MSLITLICLSYVSNFFFFFFFSEELPAAMQGGRNGGQGLNGDSGLFFKLLFFLLSVQFFGMMSKQSLLKMVAEGNKAQSMSSVTSIAESDGKTNIDEDLQSTPTSLDSLAPQEEQTVNIECEDHKFGSENITPNHFNKNEEQSVDFSTHRPNNTAPFLVNFLPGTVPESSQFLHHGIYPKSVAS